MTDPRTWEDELLSKGKEIAPGPSYHCPECGRAAHSFAIVEDPRDGEWRCSSCLAEAAREEPNPTVLTWEDIRGIRSVFLQSCDWTQMSDVPEAKRSAWASIRQDARDLTQLASPEEALTRLEELKEQGSGI